MIRIGMMIGDRYEVLEKIGTGGMADVYKAKCHKLNRFVAIKVLKQEFSENANFVSKFRTEAQATAGLMHPNIVNVYDVGEEDGIYYIVMELVEGITLKKYIEKKARLSFKEAVSIAIQVSMGIELAHNNHIIHRDIKPQNIIISKDGKVKVTDFGIAKAATSNTITSNVMGSVHYTSPEQARGGYSDEKSDIYSLGITMFEMLTGRVPFNGETTVAIAIKHIQEELPSPREFVPEIPNSVEGILMKCCQKSPDRRYQSVQELIADLKQSLMNPDDNFVVQNDPDLGGGTRTITEGEREQIKQRTAHQGHGQNSHAQESRDQGHYDQGGYPEENYDQGHYDQNGYPEENYDQGHYDPNGYPEENYDQGHYDQNGYSEENYDQGHYDQDGYSEENYDQGHYDQNGYPEENYDQGHYDQDGYPEENYDQGHYDQDGYPQGNYDQENYGRDGRGQRDYDQGNYGHKGYDHRGGERRARHGARRERYEEYEDGNGGQEDGDDYDYNPRMEKVTTLLTLIPIAVICIIAIVLVIKVFDRREEGGTDNSGGPIITGEPSSEEQSGSNQPETVKMPGVKGKSVEDVRNALKAMGIHSDVKYQESDAEETGIVIGASVEEGADVEVGSTVTLTAGSGPEGIEVPSVEGDSYEQAESKLRELGFHVTKEEESSEDVEENYVISQVPKAGNKVPKGQNVTVTVSTGKSKVMVPMLLGRTEEEGTIKAVEAGLQLSGNISYVFDSQYESGQICYQSYSYGAYVAPGTEVEIKVSKGPEPTPEVKTYRCNASIMAPTTEEAPDYVAGTEVQVLFVTDSGQVLLDAVLTSFPQAANYSGLTAPGGTITMTYNVTSEAGTTTDPDTGETVAVPGVTESRTFTRKVEFTEE